MTPFPPTPEMHALAARLVWFEGPAQALDDPVRFLAYAFRGGTPADMAPIRAHLSDDDLREALDSAPPGIIDGRSWSYWNAILGRFPPPPMPRRQLG